MKLLLCPKCFDVFKLEIGNIRSCRCGEVRGKYHDDGHTSVNNGKGVSLALDNRYIMQAIFERDNKMKNQDSSYDNYYNDCRIPFWVRPNEGTGNPRSTVNPNL